MSDGVQIDLNSPDFQADVFTLEAEQLIALFATLHKITRMTWDQVYRDKGLRWEAIHSRTSISGERPYSIRITRKFRAVARREGEYLRLLTLNPDHDSAYR